MQVSSFASDGAPQGLSQVLPQASFCQELMRRFSVRFHVETAEARPFVARMTSFASPRLHCADIDFSAHRTRFAPGGAGRSKEASFLITLQTHGQARVQQGANTSTVGPGDFFVLDTRAPFLIETEAISTRSIYVSEDFLRDQVPAIDLCTAKAVDTRRGAGRIVRVAVEELFDNAAVLDEPAAERFADVLAQSVALAVGPLARDETVPKAQAQQRPLRLVKAAIAKKLHDPSLDCAAIAASVGLSRRSVHDIFAAAGETPMRWIWSQRLERVREALTDPALRAEPISTIAYRWGFNDPAHFSRAFKAAFGVSPRQCRVGG